ncbi:unnamed protein product [Diatraea saccharalis]|uniref:Zinc finger PHD-type domain-containing protein n=1 Tax=Diatraea saccharalis TaxID=40085 RepID=A0A9N9R6A7_9NEOP|nr:unnamed protein product [Diatraea saccharalis]
MLHCGACKKFVSTTGSAACSSCAIRYHKACLGLSEKAVINKDWVCPGCTKSVQRGDNSHTPVRSLGVTPSATESSSQTGVSGDLSGNKEDRRDRELAEFMAEMREFRKEMTLLRESLSVRLDNVEQRLVAVERQRRQPS